MSAAEPPSPTNPLPARRFLLVRHPTFKRYFYDILLQWVQTNFPACYPLFDVRDLPCTIDDWSCFGVHHPWLQDPVQAWSPEAYDEACKIAAKCDEHGIPVINRVDRLLNASKLTAARLMTEAGVPTPRTVKIDDAAEFKDTLLGLRTPLMVREDWGHWSRICRVNAPEAARQIPFEAFTRPIATEIIDVRDPGDGLYRKYRYLAAGDQGVSLHLQVSQDWITRGEKRVINEETRNQELAYIGRRDPYEEILQRVRRALGLEFLAFDYGITKEGQMYVWEANPFPHIVFGSDKTKHRNPAAHRAMLAMIQMYLQAAKLGVPEWIERGLRYA